MASIPDSFRALVAEQRDGDVDRGLRELSPDELPEGDVTVRVRFSSVNYKDGLAVSPKGRVARTSPLVPGIDLAGEVVDGEGAGGEVIVHGYDLGVAHHGGYAEYARVPAGWVVPLPEGLSARQAMALGTAGYTAAYSVVQLEDRGLEPDQGPVLVLGASGGVGSTAVGILAARGYEVHASTGKADEADFLRELGATEILSREETSAEPERPLQKQRWAAVVDPVGGAATAFALTTTMYGGAVALSGMTGGATVHELGVPADPAQRRAAGGRLGRDRHRGPPPRVGAPRRRPAPARARRGDHARDRPRRGGRVPGRDPGRARPRPHRRARWAVSGARTPTAGRGRRARPPSSARPGAATAPRRTPAAPVRRDTSSAEYQTRSNATTRPAIASAHGSTGAPAGTNCGNSAT